MALHRMQLDRYLPSSMRSLLRRKQHLFTVSIKTLTHPARPSLLSPSSSAPGMIYGNKQDMIATICYIVDILAFQNPSSSAVIEEGDGFAHLFSRVTRAVVVKALAKLGAAFDVMVTRHEGEHKLLGSYRPEIMEVGCFLYWAVLDCSATNFPHSRVNAPTRTRCVQGTEREIRFVVPYPRQRNGS